MRRRQICCPQRGRLQPARGLARPDAERRQHGGSIALAPAIKLCYAAQVSFDRDVIISPVNEYEVLQLLMGDCRDLLSAYQGAFNTLTHPALGLDVLPLLQFSVTWGVSATTDRG